MWIWIRASDWWIGVDLVDLDLGAINRNLRLYIVLIGAANRTGLFGANLEAMAPSKNL